MMNFLMEYLGEFLAVVSTGFVAWFFNRKGKKLENSQKIIDLYNEALAKLKIQYDERYEFLESEYKNRDDILKESYDLKFSKLKEVYDSKFSELKKELQRLKQSQTIWRKKYLDLKKEFDHYKANHK